MYQSESGASNEFTQNAIATIVQTSRNSPFYIKYVSVENYIGKIRKLCKSDNRFRTVLHDTAGNEFISHYSPRKYLIFRTKHENPGGCILLDTRDSLHFPDTFSPQTIVQSLLSSLNLEKQKEDNQDCLIPFLNKLQRFLIDAPYKPTKVPQQLRNINIINRLFYNPKKPEKDKT